MEPLNFLPLKGVSLKGRLSIKNDLTEKEVSDIIPSLITKEAVRYFTENSQSICETWLSLPTIYNLVNVGLTGLSAEL